MIDSITHVLELLGKNFAVSVRSSFGGDPIQLPHITARESTRSVLEVTFQVCSL